MVHKGSPWTRSTKVVHGPGVRVLSFLNYKEFIRFWEFRDRSLITGEGGAGGNENLDAKILLTPP
jgi:hypothetical protein